MSTILVNLWIVVVTGCITLLPLAPRTEAGLHVYVDAAGTMHFTDVPDNSPVSDVPLRREMEHSVSDAAGSGRFGELIRRIAGEESVDPDLVRAVIQVESNFDSTAVSRKGARGLMQLMPATALQYAVPNVFDPAANIRGGSQHLRALQSRFPGQLSLVLAAYNAGEYAVLRFQGIPPYAETRRYVERVLALYDKHKTGERATASAPLSRVGPSDASESTARLPAIIEVVDGSGNVVYTTAPAGKPLSWNELSAVPKRHKER